MLFLARGHVAWEPYRDHIPAEERDDFVAAYSKRLNSTDESVQVTLYPTFATLSSTFPT